MTLRNARCNEHIKLKIDDWDHRLILFSSALKQWLRCQKEWLYLEHIFGAADMQRQMPAEARAFFFVDKSFHDLMRRTQENPNALLCATRPGVMEVLQVWSRQTRF